VRQDEKWIRQQLCNFWPRLQCFKTDLNLLLQFSCFFAMLVSQGDQNYFRSKNTFFELFRCDSPWKLINSSVYAMKSIEGDPDFLLWTGWVMLTT